MRYRSRPTECEAVQWYSEGDAPLTERCAREIVAWVNAHGGEARYVPQGEETVGQPGGYATGWSGYPRIAVRTINGWAYAAPGHYVVMGTETINVRDPGTAASFHRVRDFYPCDPETFERRWEQLGGGAS